MFSYSILLSGDSIARFFGRKLERRRKRDRAQCLGASSLSTAQRRKRRLVGLYEGGKSLLSLHVAVRNCARANER